MGFLALQTSRIIALLLIVQTWVRELLERGCTGTRAHGNPPCSFPPKKFVISQATTAVQQSSNLIRLILHQCEAVIQVLIPSEARSNTTVLVE